MKGLLSRTMRIGALAAFTALPAAAQMRTPADPRADFDALATQRIAGNENLHLSLTPPLGLVGFRGSAGDAARITLRSIQLRIQSSFGFATLSPMSAYTALRIPRVLCLQPLVSGGTSTAHVGIRYACGDLQVGTGVFVSPNVTEPRLSSVTTNSYTRYASGRFDIGVGHSTEWLGNAVGDRPAQFLSASAGVQPSGASSTVLRATSVVPLTGAVGYSRVVAAGRF